MSEFDMFSIPTISNNTNFWMVRTKRGFFYNEYIKDGFIAIGWNAVLESMLSDTPTKGELSALKEIIKETYDEKIPGTAVNKCIKFCYEMKSGDIVVIVGENSIAFATIGEYYESDDKSLTVELEKEVNNEIENSYSHATTYQCPYIKRRKIEIIREINNRSNVNPYLNSAMAKNLHSLSDMNDYDRLILSCCYDAYIYQNTLTIAFRVTCKNEINAIDLASFVTNSAKVFSNDSTENVSIKTTLHSPGDIVLQIYNFMQDYTFPLLLGYIAIFGGKAGDFELNSILGAIKGLIKTKHNREKDKIELRKLAAEADIAEQEAISKKLDNLERYNETMMSTVDSCVIPLAKSAENLEIEPNKAIIIDIAKILEDNIPKT